MVARLYNPNSTVAAVTTVAYDASWSNTGTAVRRRLMPVPDDSSGSFTLSSVSETSAVAHNALLEQLVSDPITVAKTISGTFTASTVGRALNAPGTYARYVVRLVSSAGVVRGTLFAGESVDPFNSVGAAYWSVPISGAITPLAASVGDRIVVERGVRFTNTITTSVTATMIRSATSDFPDASPVYRGDDSVSLVSRPWVEFSQDDIWEPIMRRVGGAAVETLVEPVRTPLVVGGAATEALVDPARTPLIVGGIAVEVLVPMAGQRIRTVHAAGNVDAQVYMRLPDGTWRAVSPA